MTVERTGNRLLLCIYRARNAPIVAELLEQARDADAAVTLWALDEVHPRLRSETVGCGPGAKFELCNRILAHSPPPTELVVTDDDVAIEGQLREFLDIAAAAELDLCQPAHAEDSIFSHDVTARHPDVLARLTRFVEIGPLFCVRARGLDRVLPFPRRIGMGWGLDVRWSRLVRRGLRLGVVDAVAMRHLQPAGVTYPSAGEARRLRWELRRNFVSSTEELQQTLASWPQGAPRPPWVAARS